MENKIGVISIIVKELDSVPELNSVLSEYGESIIGRMGIPYHKKKINIISVVIDADLEIINALNDKIGKLEGVSSKLIYN